MALRLDQRGWTPAQHTRPRGICGRPAILRSPRGKPCHRTCAVAWVNEWQDQGHEHGKSSHGKCAALMGGGLCPLQDAPATGPRTPARPGSAERATAPDDEHVPRTCDMAEPRRVSRGYWRITGCRKPSAKASTGRVVDALPTSAALPSWLYGSQLRHDLGRERRVGPEAHVPGMFHSPDRGSYLGSTSRREEGAL